MHVHMYLLFCVILFVSQLQGSADAEDTLRNTVGDKIDDTKMDTLEFEKSLNSEMQQKQNNGSTIWLNMTGLLDKARAISLSSVEKVQKVAYMILQTYNNLFNIYTKRARAISGQMQVNNQRLSKLEHDLDSLVEDLYQKYEKSDSYMKTLVKILLDKALGERDKLNKKKIAEYSILECREMLGIDCGTDDDCSGKGCLLQCKTSGYLWWQQSVCR